jgi:hypothetical protein
VEEYRAGLEKDVPSERQHMHGL